jgi:hypothetical protein
MPWRDAQQIQIFAPPVEPYLINWVEQILGTTVRPIYKQYSDDIRWLWVTRYCRPYDKENPPGGSPLPQSYCSDDCCRYIWFRVSVRQETKDELRNQVLRYAADSGCHTHPSGWVEYHPVADGLGSNRFIRAEATEDERVRRAQLLVHFVDATVKLMLDLLTRAEDGSWHFEPSAHTENPNGSVFESVHHLFCNATQVPTTVLLRRLAGQLQVATFWMSPSLIDLAPAEEWSQFRLRY